jgi:predicted ATPase/class 3 adenylate cyclase
VFELRGYSVDRRIYEGRKALVFGATRAADGRAVVLKVLRDEYPSARDLAAFRAEYALGRELVEAGVAGVVAPLALEPRENSLVMVLEDFGGITLADHAAYRRLGAAEFLDVACAVTRALAGVHGQGVVHKDIKPQNVLIHRDTGDVRLTDFGISSRLSSGEPGLVGVERLEGTLAYIAPEQTGRMNRSVDQRSDLYALGATFFELLAGRPPFVLDDPMALVHAHIARQPERLDAVAPGAPTLLADLVAKLLCKSALERYQSAAGLLNDLERCRELITPTGDIAPFPLGERDVGERLRLPQRLYGRAREVARLLAAFDRASAGGAEVLFVEGWSGVGKTRLVHEVKRSLARLGGMFVGGKIDQNQRAAPYSAFAQALGEFVRQVLTEPPETVDRWRAEILGAIGDRGALILGVVPDLERIVGPQPELGELGSVEARNRFQEVFVDFVGGLATREHPLALFLDDLQWADPASLALLQRLVTDRELDGLLVVGAYRDNEVPPDHPLALAIAEMEAGGARLGRMHLGGLRTGDLSELVADALRCPVERAAPLAALVHRKTGGNPFFVGQFLSALERGGLLRIEDGAWAWDIERIARQDLTDNVVELTSERISGLPEASARALQLAACIGGSFSLRPLAAVLEGSVAEAGEALWPAVEAGLVAPLDDTYRLTAGFDGDDGLDPPYRFAHDRVQQAAYEQLAPDERAAAHLRLGRSALRGGDPAALGERAFAIADHVNAAGVLVADPAERRAFALVNLVAGRLARFSAAFEPALRYLRAGRAFLGEELWRDPEGRSFELVADLAETEYLAGNHDAADGWFSELLERAGGPLDRARIHHQKLVLYGNQGRYGDALDSTVAALAELGQRYPARPGQGAVLVELLQAQWLLRGRKVEELDQLPALTDPRIQLAVEVLNAASGPAYFFDANAFAVLGLRLLNLTLRHGNSRVSAYAYAIYGMVAGSVLGRYEQGQAFADLAGRLNERFGNRDLVAKLGLIRGGLIGHWRHPLRQVYGLMKAGYTEGRVSGDLLYTGYCANALLYCMVAAGEPLDVVHTEAARYLEFQTRTRDFDASRTFVVHQRMARLLQGRTDATNTFSGDGFDEAEFVAILESIAMKIPLCLHHTMKLKACCLFGHWEQGLEHADRSQEVASSSPGLAFSSEYQHYHALNVLIHGPRMAPPQRRKRWREARKCIAQMRVWAEHSPTTFAHRVALLDAELARGRGDGEGAMRHYEAAIEGARAHGFPQDEGLACERAGRFHADGGRARLARFYLMDAVHAYARWGAQAKVDQLQAEYPEVRWAAAGPTPSLASAASVGSSTTSGIALDFHTVVKAMQAMSGEIETDRLLALMMQVVVENAGAERGTLLLQEAGELRIRARGPAAEGAFDVRPGDAVDPSELPATMLAYVERTERSLVVHDAAESPEHAADPYVARARPRSVLCAPVLRHGRLVGVLYLENNLQGGVFTERRLETIALLTSQLAISLENARLYDQQREMATASSRFVPTEFLELLGRESLQKVRLGDSVERELTVLFSDIRAFTSLSEGMSPEENFAFLNSYLGGVGPVIRAHRGFIDKYIGDAVMALFPTEPADSLAAAVAMQRFVGAFNAAREERGLGPITIGIGLHAGRVMLGTIGEAARLDGTVISDAVNIAARLEELTKVFGAGIAVSAPTLDRVNNPSRFEHRLLGRVRLRGRREDLEIFEVFEHAPPGLRELRRSTRDRFEAAVRSAVNGRWDDAASGFEDVLATDPSDLGARHLLERARSQSHAETASSASV